MNETTRVPQSIGEFDICLNTTDDYLQGSRDGRLISEFLGNHNNKITEICTHVS